MSGNDLSAAADHHLSHVSPDQNLPVPVGHRRRVGIGAAAHQGQGTHPAGLLVASVVGHGGPGQQGLQVRSRSMRWPMVSEWPRSTEPIRPRQLRSKWAFKASKLWKDGTGTRKLRRR